MCLCEFLCISGVATFVLQAATSEGTGKANKVTERACTRLIHTNLQYIGHKHVKQQAMMESLSSCRDSKGQRVCVASGVKHLPWWVCVAAVHSGVKLQLCVELPVVQAQTTQTTPWSNTKPQAPGLWWQLLHHRGKEGGRGQLLVPSREAGEQHQLCGCPQPAGCAQCVRWAASSAVRFLLYAHGNTQDWKGWINHNVLVFYCIWGSYYLVNKIVRKSYSCQCFLSSFFF